MSKTIVARVLTAVVTLATVIAVFTAPVSAAEIAPKTVVKVAAASENTTALAAKKTVAKKTTKKSTKKVAVKKAVVSNIVESTGDATIDEIVRLTNEARKAEGLQPLKINTVLNQAAAIRVPELPASPAPHVRPNGDAFHTIFKETKLSVKAGGENYAIASANAFTAEQIVTAWMNSPSHRKNIMNAKYTQIGIGHGVIGENEYYEQLFIA